MRTLAAFGLICGGLLTVLLVTVGQPVTALLWGNKETPPTPPATLAVSPVVADSSASSPMAVPQAATPLGEGEVDASAGQSNAAVAAPSATTSVHWATDPQRVAAEETMARALATLQREPRHEAALRDLLAAARQGEDWGHVQQALTGLLDLYPEDLALQRAYGAALLRVGRVVEALPALRTVVEAVPDDAEAWFNLAVAHQSLGHLGEARTAWDRALALRPTAEAHAQRGTVLLELTDYPAAMADFEAVLKRDPQADDAALNLALAAARLGDTARARATLEALLARRPQHVPALNRLAELLWAQRATDRKAAANDTALRAEVAALCKRSLAARSDQPTVEALLAATEQP